MSEAWLRGPVEGVPQGLQPAAHSLIDAVEDIERAVAGLTTPQLWMMPGGAASVGFHLAHVAGSIDRLLAYARGEVLSQEQLQEIKREGEPGDSPLGLEDLRSRLLAARERALETYRSTDPDSLSEPRLVGRAGLPSTVQGLMFHAAEHARRHAGQVVATAAIIRGLDQPGHERT